VKALVDEENKTNNNELLLDADRPGQEQIKGEKK